MERSITKIGKIRRNEIKEVITPFDKSKTSILPNLAQKTLLLLAWKASGTPKMAAECVCVCRKRE
jgi:hypothetical protein